MTDPAAEQPAQQEQEQPQTPTFTTGFDFLNHHLNMAMRYTERATPVEDKHIGHQTAFKLAAQHTELARVGALAAIAQQLQQHGVLGSGAMADLTAAVNRVSIQMQEDRAARMGHQSPQDPAQDLVAPLPGPGALDGFGDAHSRG